MLYGFLGFQRKGKCAVELGEKLRQARLAAGLSQRQLVGERITRNMLSQIENGSAAPSMDTLRFLAQRLGKPVSFFLEDEEPQSAFLDKAWLAYESGDAAAALRLLEQHPEAEAGRRERWLLQSLSLLCLARESMEQGREAYAGNLLEQARELEGKLPFLPELRERRLILRAALRLPVEQAQLPDMDDRLYLHAYAAMRSDAPQRAAAYLDAAQDNTASRWRLLRARAFMAQGEYAAAARLLQLEEKRCPGETMPLLEQCFRELGDFQLAYHYACLGRG